MENDPATIWRQSFKIIGMPPVPNPVQSRRIILAVMVLMIAAPLIYFAWRVVRERQAIWLERELSRQTYLFMEIGRRMTKIHSSGERLPDSVSGFREALNKQMPAIVNRDDRDARVLERTVLLRDVTERIGNSGSEHYDWLIVLWVPKFAGMSDDAVYYRGPSGTGGHAGAEKARQRLGDQVVDAAYRRYREDVTAAATRPASVQNKSGETNGNTNY